MVRFLRNWGWGCYGLWSEQEPVLPELQRGRQEADMVTGREGGVCGPLTHFAFPAKWDLASNNRAGLISPTSAVARSALGLGLQAPCRRETPGNHLCAPASILPCGASSPAWAWKARQPSLEPAALMPLPNTRPLMGLFWRTGVPKQSSKPAIRKAAKGLTFSGLWAFQWER